MLQNLIRYTSDGAPIYYDSRSFQNLASDMRYVDGVPTVYVHDSARYEFSVGGQNPTKNTMPTLGLQNLAWLGEDGQVHTVNQNSNGGPKMLGATYQPTF